MCPHPTLAASPLGVAGFLYLPLSLAHSGLALTLLPPFAFHPQLAGTISWGSCFSAQPLYLVGPRPGAPSFIPRPGIGVPSSRPILLLVSVMTEGWVCHRRGRLLAPAWGTYFSKKTCYCMRVLLSCRMKGPTEKMYQP